MRPDYDRLAMRRLMNRDAALAEEFLARARGTSDFGESVLLDLFHERVVPDPILTTRYQDIAGIRERTHVPTESPATRTIEIGIALYGWRGFIEALVLLSRNKEATLKAMGLSRAAETWDKIAKVVHALPKNPQL